MAGMGVLAGAAAPERAARRIDRLGGLACTGGVLAALVMPLLVFKSKRIASGDPHSLLTALPPVTATLLALLLLGIGPVVLLSHNTLVRLAAGATGLIAL